MSRLWRPAAALCAAWMSLAGAVADTALAPAIAPPDLARPALMVSGAAQARLFDLTQAGERLVAVGQQGVILVSDTGEDWRQVPSPASALLTRVRFLDRRRGWAVGYDATILHTSDGGNSWTLQHRDPEARVLYDILFLDARHGIAVGGYGSYYRTADGGKTWQAQAFPLTQLGQHFNRLLRLDARTLFIAGERGLLARSSDGGASWAMLRSPYVGSFFGAIPLGGRRVLVFGMRGNAYVADDIGTIPVQDPSKYDPYTAQTLTDPAQIAALGWRRIDSPIRESLFGGAALADGSVLLVGTNAVALRSDAALRTLTPVTLPAAETLVDVLPHAAGLWAVGRRGVQNLGTLP